LSIPVVADVRVEVFVLVLRKEIAELRRRSRVPFLTNAIRATKSTGKRNEGRMGGEYVVSSLGKKKKIVRRTTNSG
jgi:hypothetical protein